MSTFSDEQVEQVLAEFDFEKVHKVMTLLDWTYFDTQPAVPSVEHLQGVARVLFGHLKSGIAGSSATGGFQAYIEDDETGPILGLTFTLATANINL